MKQKTLFMRALGIAIAVMMLPVLLGFAALIDATPAAAQGTNTTQTPQIVVATWTPYVIYVTPTAGAPTQTPVYQVVTGTVAAQSPVAMATDCPTLADLRLSTGLDWTRIGSEVCAYMYNTADMSYKNMVLLEGWMTTTARSDGFVHVRKGDGTTVEAKATTIRLLKLYPNLTSEMQTQLTAQYAPLAGYSPALVICDDCFPGFVVRLTLTPTPNTTPASNVTPNTTPAAPTMPTVNGYDCSPITGGYVCMPNTTPVIDFVVPQNWTAKNNTGDHQPDTNLGPQGQVSLYPQ